MGKRVVSRRSFLAAAGGSTLVAGEVSGGHHIVASTLPGKAPGEATGRRGPASRLRVAIAQIPVTENISANVETISRAVDFAIADNAEILLTPEGSLSGYRNDFDQGQLDQGLRQMVAKAAAGRLALALGTCYREADGRCYNQIRFYDEEGAFLGFHSKILLTASKKDPAKGEVNKYATSPLRTFKIKGIVVGGLICNDLWANPGATPTPDPHLSRQLAGKCARIIFHAVNGWRNGSNWSQGPVWAYHESNLQMRARADKLWIVSADNCFPTTIRCSAPSGVVRPDGSWAVKAASHGERLLAYTIELA